MICGTGPPYAGVVHPRHAAPVDLTLLEGAVQAWYRPRTAARLRVRAALVLVIVLGVAGGGLALGPTGLPLVALALLALPAALHAATVLREAGEVWGLDDGFALAVRDDGLVLPRFGHVTWAEVTGVRVVESPLTSPLARFQRWLGLRSERVLHVYVADVAGVGSRAPERHARRTVTDPSGRLRGWTFAADAQLEPGDLDDVLLALRRLAPGLVRERAC